VFESILSFFGNTGATGGFSVAASLFNTYAQMRAGREQRNEQIWQAKRAMAYFDEENQKVAEAQQEYGAIISYQIDQLRQNQLSKRHQLAHALLSSGMGITPTDSAGLMLRFQGYQDEMAARAGEAEMVYHRPKPKSMDKEALRHGIGKMREAAPFQDIGQIVKGGSELINIFRQGGSS
jgi:hypothetical protein